MKVMCVQAPEQVPNVPDGECVLSAAVPKVKNATLNYNYIKHRINFECAKDIFPRFFCFLLFRMSFVSSLLI